MFVIVLYFFSLSILLHSLPFSTLPCVLGGSPSRIISTVYGCFLCLFCVVLCVFFFLLFFLLCIMASGTRVLMCWAQQLWGISSLHLHAVLRRPTYIESHIACQSLSEPCHTVLPASDFNTTLLFFFKPRSGSWVLTAILLGDFLKLHPYLCTQFFIEPSLNYIIWVWLEWLLDG